MSSQHLAGTINLKCCIQAGRQAGRQPVPITPATNAYLKKCPGWQGMVRRSSKCCSWSFGIFLDFLDFFYLLLFFCSRLRLAQHYWFFLWFKWIVFKVFFAFVCSAILKGHHDPPIRPTFWRAPKNVQYILYTLDWFWCHFAIEHIEWVERKDTIDNRMDEWMHSCTKIKWKYQPERVWTEGM